MSAKRLLGFGLAAGGLGYGGYYASQAKEVGKFESEAQSAQKLIDAEANKLKATKKAIGEQESRTTALRGKLEGCRKAVEETETELEEARKQVQELEKKHEARQEAASKVAKDLDSVASKILALKRDEERSSAAVTLGEKSMQMARAQAAEARQLLYNPLRHPKVKELLRSK